MRCLIILLRIQPHFHPKIDKAHEIHSRPHVQDPNHKPVLVDLLAVQNSMFDVTKAVKNWLNTSQKRAENVTKRNASETQRNKILSFFLGIQPISREMTPAFFEDGVVFRQRRSGGRRACKAPMWPRQRPDPARQGDFSRKAAGVGQSATPFCPRLRGYRA